MVESGLVPQAMFVDHIKLATHFITALVLLSYTFWFALSLSVPSNMKVVNKSLKKITWVILIILFFQLIYGAFMAGLHAATAAPTWPTINGKWFPDVMNTLSPSWKNFLDNKITIQFIHRGLAYTLFILVIFWFIKASKIVGSSLFSRTKIIPLLLVVLQILLGIATVVLSPYGNNLVWFGVIHQLVAILFLISIIFMMYLIRSSVFRKRIF